MPETINTTAQDALRQDALRAHQDARDALVQVEYARKGLQSAQDEAETAILRRDALTDAVRAFDPEWRPRG